MPDPARNIWNEAEVNYSPLSETTTLGRLWVVNKLCRTLLTAFEVVDAI